MEEGRDLGMLLPGFGRRKIVTVLVLEGLLLCLVAEEVAAVDPGLEIAVERHAVGRAAILVEQRHALGAVDVTLLRIVPFRLMLCDEVVELGDAAGLGQVS